MTDNFSPLRAAIVSNVARVSGAISADMGTFFCLLAFVVAVVAMFDLL